MLSHPNIVAALDANEAAGHHYLVMEYVPGQDLAEILRQDGPLPVDAGFDNRQRQATQENTPQKHHHHAGDRCRPSHHPRRVVGPLAELPFT
jgi:hypothetical protein